MRYLFITQSGSLRPFYEIYLALKAKQKAERAIFIVTDKRAFRYFCQERPDFLRRDDIRIVREWELSGATGGRPDWDQLKNVEQAACGDAGLFGAILSDRRLVMGPRATLGQDYRRRLDDSTMLSILSNGVREVEDLLEREKPDVVVGFICVTWLDYLVPLLARARGVVTLNLRPTKIGNHVIADPYLRDPSPSLRQTWADMLAGGAEPGPFARHHVEQVLQGYNKYEGVAKPLKFDQEHLSWRDVARLLRDCWHHFRHGDAADNAVVPPWLELSETRFRRRARRRGAMAVTRGRNMAPADLPTDRRIIFFPLHYEPEVQLLVYARPYVNQIEICRAIAHALPVDAILLVKEHPRMPGRRNPGWYQKLLDIPRLHLADEAFDSIEYTRRSDLVVTLGGSIGLDAVMLGKPVICLGASQYGLLPPHMVVDTRDLAALRAAIKKALQEYRFNRRLIELYVDMIAREAVPVDWYSKLLLRADALAYRDADRNAQVELLADYLDERAHRFRESYPDYSGMDW